MNGRRPPARTLTREQQDKVEEARPTARKLALAMARRCKGFEAEELCAIAEAKLATEVRRYDSTRGPSLAQFALKAMVGAILRFARKQGSGRLEAARRAGLVHAEGLQQERDLAREIAETEEERRRRSHELGEDFAAAMFLGYLGKPPQPSVEDAFTAHEAVHKLREATSALDREDATLLELLYWQELDWDAAAARLGVSVSSAQRREERLLPRLKAVLQAKGVREAPRGSE